MQLLKDLAELDAALARDAELILAVFEVDCVCENGEVGCLELDLLVLYAYRKVVAGLGYFLNFNICGADLLSVGCCIILIFNFIFQWEVSDVQIRSFLGTQILDQLVVFKIKGDRDGSTVRLNFLAVFDEGDVVEKGIVLRINSLLTGIQGFHISIVVISGCPVRNTSRRKLRVIRNDISVRQNCRYLNTIRAAAILSPGLTGGFFTGFLCIDVLFSGFCFRGFCFLRFPFRGFYFLRIPVCGFPFNGFLLRLHSSILFCSILFLVGCLLISFSRLLLYNIRRITLRRPLDCISIEKRRARQNQSQTYANQAS